MSSAQKPLWDGPCRNTPHGGVTFSLLSKFLVCPERFYHYAIEGLRPAPTFNHRIEYGTMWHLCIQSGDRWESALTDYALSLAKEFPFSHKEIGHWYDVCKVQYAIYMEKVAITECSERETVFNIPYMLPSGKTVILRGKFDGLLPGGSGLYECKTKSLIAPDVLERQLSFDLQTMLYLTVLHLEDSSSSWKLVYEVIKRPLSGGKYSIYRYEPSRARPTGETLDDFYGRLKGIIQDVSSEFFWRKEFKVTSSQIHRFRMECLDPLLMRLVDWYSAVTSNPSRFGSNHWRYPYGVWNSLNDDGFGDTDNYLQTGEKIGLVEVNSLFSELV